MKKLPIEFKEQWITALRSGDYNQCSGYMRKGDRFCCLGVAYELIHKDEINRAWLGPSPDSAPVDVFFTGAGKAYLPGIGDYPPDIWEVLNQEIHPAISGLTHLSNMNDGGKTFGEIADWIEENL